MQRLLLGFTILVCGAMVLFGAFQADTAMRTALGKEHVALPAFLWLLVEENG